MNISANDSSRKSWIKIPENSDFPIQNIPFGVTQFGNGEIAVSTRIGDMVINLSKLHELGYISAPEGVFSQRILNPFIECGKQTTRDVRNQIAEVFDASNNKLSDNQDHVSSVCYNLADVTQQFPLEIGDYTDFYSSVEHATNVGTMFRDPDNALLPNWKHIPVGYHGRASSIILSGEEIRRPKGQTKPNEDEPPVYGPCRLLDFELEMAFVTYPGKPMGDSISTAEADDYIFGMCLFNDWSARDIQKWEYIPLGPFLAKNFASSISPWIVTLDALEPFRVAGPTQDPKVLPYLEYSGDKNIDIALEVSITPDNGTENVVCKSNYKYMYWNMNQQLAHHTVNGCNVRAGDMMASGTISGKDESAYGSMLELAWKGTKPLSMNDGTERKFIADLDTVTMRGWCSNGEVRVGFGEVSTKVLPAN